MPEIKELVQTFEVNYQCDKCGKGIMLPTGIAHLTAPPSYPHECTVCDARFSFNKRYPLVVTQTIP